MRFVFLLLAFYICLPLSASARTYLLSEGIDNSQSVSIKDMLTAASLRSLESTNFAVSNYLATGDVGTSAVIAGWDAITSFPNGTLLAPAVTLGKVKLKNFLDYRKFAKLAKDRGSVRMLRMEHITMRGGLFPLAFYSKTYVFVDTKDDKPPPDFQGKKWLAVDDPAGTKLRLSLELDNYDGKPLPTVELSVKDLFEGRRVNPEVQEVWLKAIEDWKKSGMWKGRPAGNDALRADAFENNDYDSLMRAEDDLAKHRQTSTLKRYITNFSKKMHIEASFLHDGETFDLGVFAPGHQMPRILNQTRTQRLLGFLAHHTPGLNRDQFQFELKAQPASCLIRYRDKFSSLFRKVPPEPLTAAPPETP